MSSPRLCGVASVALVVVSALVPGAARAQTAPAPLDSAAESEPSAPEVGQHAEEVEAQLRHIKESLSDTRAVTALEGEVAGLKRRVAERWAGTSTMLKDKPRHLSLDSLASSWEELRAEVEDASGRVEARVRRRAADLETLAKLHASWVRSLDLARQADASAFVVGRAQATIAAIDATRPLVEQRGAGVLGLQDAVGRSLEACDDALARIADARREALERLFREPEPPVWQIRDPLLGVRGSGPRLVAGIAAGIESLRIYARAHGVGLALSGAFCLALIVILRRAPGQLQSSARGAALLASAGVFETPYSAAILLATALSRPLRPSPPIALMYVLLPVVLVAAVFVLRPRLDAGLRRGVWGLTALYLVELGSLLLAAAPALQQVVLIVVKGATAALLLWVAARLGSDGALGGWSPPQRSAGRMVLRALALVCVASAVAAALGYVDLADMLGGGALFLVYVAFALLAFRIAADGLVAIALVRGPLARLHAVALHRELVERRIRRLLDVLAVALWIWFALTRFELLEPTRGVLGDLLEARLHAGALDIPVRQVLGFVAVVIGSGLAARLIVFLLEEDVYSRMALPRGIPYAFSTLTRYGILLVGFLVALAMLGLDLTRLTVLVSAFGVGLGFGLQQIVNNFVSGLILIFERPVQIGDAVQLGTLSGEVTRIGIRSSTVRTAEGAEVVVPNSSLIEQMVTNWTLSDWTRRVELALGVAHGVDAARILPVLLEVAGREPRIVAHPPAEALFMGFGEKALQFELRFWTEEPNWMRLRSDVGVALQEALRARGIEGPKT